jgi:hypothetical protein
VSKLTYKADDGPHILLNDSDGGINLIGPFRSDDEACYHGKQWEKRTGLLSWQLVSSPTVVHLTAEQFKGEIEE